MWEFLKECSLDGSCIEMHSFDENTYLMITKFNEKNGFGHIYSLMGSVNLNNILVSIDDSLVPAERKGHMFFSDSIDALNYIIDIVKKTIDIMGTSDIISVYIEPNSEYAFSKGDIVSCSFDSNENFSLQVSVNIENIYLPNHSTNEVFVKNSVISFDEMLAIFL